MGSVNLRTVRPLGTFHARSTRDGEAHQRDGQTFVLINELGEDGRGGRSVEIMFEDGVWMLATTTDLELADGVAPGLSRYAAALANGAKQYAGALDALSQAGFSPVFTQTGGMCAAIEVARSNRSVLITDEDGPLPWDSTELHIWCVGLYERSDTDREPIAIVTTPDNSNDVLVSTVRELFARPTA